MSISPRNLWPEDIAVSEDVPPVSILKEQGVLLGQRTNNLVEGRVRGGPSEYERKYLSPPEYDRTQFHYTFELVAPVLNEYRYELFGISHGVDSYPVRIDWDSPDNLMLLKVSGEAGIEDEEQFLKALEIIFSSAKTRKVISSLIAQSRAVGPSRKVERSLFYAPESDAEEAEE